MGLFGGVFGDSKGKSACDEERVQAVFAQLDGLRRSASVAELGEFRPPNDPRTSWFGNHAVALPGEGIPASGGKAMFPLLQVNCTDLPYVPPELAGTALFVVWLGQDEPPFDRPHGDGWLIREYEDLAGLELIPDTPGPEWLRSFPIRWRLDETEAPGWDDAWHLVDLNPVNDSEAARNEFFDRYTNQQCTKVGGYPSLIQSSLGDEGEFVFQIGSEEKANWMWFDCGVAYFTKTRDGQWRFDCQFY